MGTKENISTHFEKIFNKILKDEEETLKNQGLKELTLNELHLLVKIDDLSKQGQFEIKDLIDELNLTKGTVSTSINRLVNKNYIIKEHDVFDKRKIILKLKPKAQYAIKLHRDWHHLLVQKALNGLSQKESEVLLLALKNINSII